MSDVRIGRNERARSAGRLMLSKVPEVTIFFWIIKILATTVGETAADFLNDKLGLGLTNTTLIMTGLLVVVLVAQFRVRRYIPSIYWLTVVLISIVGTLFTDNLSDGFGVSLVISTSVFAVVLAIVFGLWYSREKTLSIHSIDTTSREAWYWVTVLFTFALGTAAGDLVAERLAIGYWESALMFGGMIAFITAAHYISKAVLGTQHKRQSSNAVLAFWLAYILTRPLGASIGDYMSQPHSDGGLHLGTVGTTLIFLGTILALVVYLTVSKKDELRAGSTDEELADVPRGGEEDGVPEPELA